MIAIGTRLGAYQVTSLIGQGGMGEVYRARDTLLERDVALKLVPETFASDPERLARFHREAKVLASLNHPLNPFNPRLKITPDSVELVRARANCVYKIRVGRETIALKLRPIEKALRLRVAERTAVWRELRAVIPTARPWRPHQLDEVFVTAIDDEYFLASAFEWIDGKAGDQRSQKFNSSLAAIVARIHNWQPSRGLDGIPLCGVRLNTQSNVLDGTLRAIARELSPGHRKKLEQIGFTLKTPKPAECLVHGDPSACNFLNTADGKIVALDLDACGAGSPADDLGLIYFQLAFIGAASSLWADFIDEYGKFAKREVEIGEVLWSAVRHAVGLVRLRQDDGSSAGDLRLAIRLADRLIGKTLKFSE